MINTSGINFSVWLCVTVLAAANGRETDRPVLSVDRCYDQHCGCFAISWLCYDAATKWEDVCEYLPTIHLPVKPHLFSKARLRCIITLVRDRCAAHQKNNQLRILTPSNSFQMHVSNSDTLEETVTTPSYMIHHLTVPVMGFLLGQPVGYSPDSNSSTVEQLPLG